MGENTITPEFKTEEELDNYVAEYKWDMICIVTIILVNNILKTQKEIEQQKQTLEQDTGL